VKRDLENGLNSVIYTDFLDRVSAAKI